MKELQLQKYPAYKDSGVEWLGEIPEHWEVIPGLAVVEERKEKNLNLIEKNVLSLSYGSIIVKDENKLTGLVPESFETYQIVYPEDIIIRPTDLQNDKVSLRTGYSYYKGIITSAYINLKVKKDFYPYFVYLYLHTIDITKVIYGLGSGLRQNLSFLDLRRLPFIIPPFEEQQTIANFLDKKTAQIDKAIAQKEELITLLKERKQIIINQAVTRGLNPDVPMKDSGIDWIGEIPEHWEVKKVKYLASIKSGDGITNSEIKDCGTFEVYGGNGLIGFCEKYNIEGKKIIIGRVGALCGNVRYTDTKKFISDNALILTCRENNFSYYMSILLEAANLNSLNTSNAQPLITGTKVLNISIPIPSLFEQQEIINYIQENIQKIDKTISLKQQEIDRLKEYKLSLIDNVVRGKIRVNEKYI